MHPHLFITPACLFFLFVSLLKLFSSSKLTISIVMVEFLSVIVMVSMLSVVSPTHLVLFTLLVLCLLVVEGVLGLSLLSLSSISREVSPRSMSASLF